MKLATLISFNSFGMSGLATLTLKDEDGNTFQLPCDNAHTARTLNALFPGFITTGHQIDNRIIHNQPVLYGMDEFNLMLGELTPA